MQCLFDADILRYEIGFAAEASWKYKNEGQSPDWFLLNPPPWPLVEEILEQRILHVQTECESDTASLFFFTGKRNFRNEIAKRQPYKVRAGYKPYHFKNIELYLQCNYEWRLTEGLEADDLIAIEQTSRIDKRDTIICTRDKDLRSVDGWQYGWELGEQPSFGPKFVSGYGSISLSADRKKIQGWGLKFFLSQCLTGDTVDSIPGLPKCGPVASYELLHNTKTYLEGLEVVKEAYENKYGGEAGRELLEQGCLLWMTRELDENSEPVLWNFWTDYERKV